MKTKIKTAIVVTIIAIPWLLFVSLFAVLRANAEKNGTLIVNDQYITDVNIVRDPLGRGLMLPLAETIQKLGYDVTDINSQMKRIEKDDRWFIMDIQELTVLEEDDPISNCLDLAPGGYRFRYVGRYGDDIVLDVWSFANAVDLMGTHYRVLSIDALRTVILY